MLLQALQRQMSASETARVRAASLSLPRRMAPRPSLLPPLRHPRFLKLPSLLGCRWQWHRLLLRLLRLNRALLPL